MQVASYLTNTPFQIILFKFRNSTRILKHLFSQNTQNYTEYSQDMHDLKYMAAKLDKVIFFQSYFIYMDIYIYIYGYFTHMSKLA